MASMAGSKGGINSELKEKLRGMRKSNKGIDSEVVGLDVPEGHIVEEGVVYEMCFGGPNRPVGYVKDGVAYQTRIGGPDVPMSSFRF